MDIRHGIPGLARGTIRPARPQRDASTASSWLVQVRPFVLTLACTLGLSLGGATLTGSRADAAAKPLRCDFDGDGKSDLAAGVPGDMKLRGAVNVQYSPEGLLEKGEHFLRPDNLPGVSKVDGRLGSALACGDFDGDGFADLAIGAPGEQDSSGAIVAAYGSASGLWDKHGTYLAQSNIDLGIIDPVEPGDRFGEALAVGDFNGDGWDDLAIGVPGESSPFPAETPGGPTGPNVLWVGMVHVVFGSAKGLMGPAQSFSPFTPGVCCFTEADDHGPHYGAALAVGDFDADGLEDLAIGAPFADVTLSDGKTVAFAGAVHILRGEKGTGLVLIGQGYLHEGLLTDRTAPRSWELFGLVLATGQFDGRRGDDLAIGAPYERLNDDFGGDSGYNGYGAVYVAYFDGAGLVPSSSVVFMDVAPGPVPDAPSDGDRFGWALAAGNFDRRHDDDLAIGIPGNHTTTRTQDDGVVGAVYVLYSHGAGLGEAGASFFFPGDFEGGVQTPPPPEGIAFEFGAALAAGDYQGDGVADLFIGVPALSLALHDVGGVEIRPGVAGVGLGSGPSYLLLHQGTSQPGQTWVPEEHNLAFITEHDVDPFIFRGERMGHALAR